MDIIPLILSEDTAGKLPSDILLRLASCSTDVVIEKVTLYLENPEADSAVKAKIQSAFGEVLSMRAYMSDVALQEKVELIQNLDFGNVSPVSSVDDMRLWKDTIVEVLGNVYSVPYISPINGSIIREIREDVLQLYRDTKDADYKVFEGILRRASMFFRDAQHAHAKGTVLKRVLRSRDKFLIIVRGLDFMIEQKTLGKSPASWRCL